MRLLIKILMIILIAGLTEIWLMVDFWGWIGIAGTFSAPIAASIIAIGVLIWQELKKQETRYAETSRELNNINDFLQKITRSQIQEKIAVLNDYATQIPDWKDKNLLEHKTNRIISDIRAIQQVRTLLTDTQKEELHTIKEEIISVIGQDYANKIKAAFEVVFSTEIKR